MAEKPHVVLCFHQKGLSGASIIRFCSFWCSVILGWWSRNLQWFSWWSDIFLAVGPPVVTWPDFFARSTQSCTTVHSCKSFKELVWSNVMIFIMRVASELQSYLREGHICEKHKAWVTGEKFPLWFSTSEQTGFTRAHFQKYGCMLTFCCMKQNHKHST